MRIALLSIVATVVAAMPAQAKLGYYPYLNLRYNQGQQVSNQVVDGVAVSRYQGDFISKHERRWQVDNISVWARNTNRQPRCILVRFTHFGTGLGPGSSWGNEAIFYMKPGQTLQNFAGITSTSKRFGMRGFNFTIWHPIARNKCGAAPPRA